MTTGYQKFMEWLDDSGNLRSDAPANIKKEYREFQQDEKDYWDNMNNKLLPKLV